MSVRWLTSLPPTSRPRVFVDADVLASPQARTIPYLARPLADYELMYSPMVEEEAMRHQKPGQVPIRELRARFDWLLVPDPDQADMDRLVDTHPKDKHVLAAAIAGHCWFVMTGNVRHYGFADHAASGISAVHPGLFLSHRLSGEAYREVVAALGSARSRPPREPISIHEQEIAWHIPALFDRYRNLFGAPHPDPRITPPHLQFRGPRCLACGQLTTDQPGTDGLCRRCHHLTGLTPGAGIDRDRGVGSGVLRYSSS